MKAFRITDLVGQLILILSGIVDGIMELIGHPHFFFIYFYFFVGGWQMVSFLIHHFFSTPTVFYRERVFYWKICMIVIGLAILLYALCFASSDLVVLLLLYAFALLWLSPILAFYYLYICWKEYDLVTKRELIHLK